MKMTPNRYQQEAARFMNDELTRVDQERHALFLMSSELGEVQGIYQKWYQGHEIKQDHLKKEIGDLLWGIAELCTVNNFDLEEIMQINIDKLSARYPNGFEAEKSLHRKEGDI